MKQIFILLFAFCSLFITKSFSQQTDIKQALKNQIKFFQIQQEKEEKSLFNQAVNSYEAVKEAEAYLKSKGVPIFEDDKEKRALADAIYSAGLKERQAKQQYINKLERELKQLENPIIQTNTQPLNKSEKEKISNLVKGIEAHQQIQSNYDTYLQRQQQLQQNLQQQLQRQEQLESIQQQSQPINQQQRQNLQQVVAKIQEQQQQQQQQQQQIFQQQQQLQQQQQQIQQQAQPIPQQQQQMLQQLIQAIQQQQQQTQRQQQMTQNQQEQFQQAMNK